MINYFLLGCFLPEEVKLSEPLSGSMDQDSLDPPSKRAKLDYDHYVSPYTMSIYKHFSGIHMQLGKRNNIISRL